jgi:non-specific serine/threonine protein kinase
VRCHSDKGELEAAIGHARRWLELDRMNEAAHRHLMQLYGWSGQRSAALRQYEECLKVLEEKLGEAPEDSTAQLYEAIKENRLVSGFSSIKSPGGPPGRPSTPGSKVRSLPAQLTSFIGREREMAEVKHLLNATRLLTLTGSGGCGKTRLALEVASGLTEEYEDGVWLVELAALSDADLIPQAVSSALGVREVPGRPLTEVLSDHLRSKRLLLVMDNCEHLIRACATVIERLLRSCPSLKVLATSREALGIGGETAWRVPSLSLPDSKSLGSMGESELRKYEAISLFLDRSAAAHPSFKATGRNAQAVAQICCRLDGIPLAIELAAARVKGLSAEQIASRLDDRFRLLTGGSRTALPRQQTLRATMDWSYELLSEAERVLLNRLSVFVGGWTLPAAEAVAGDTEGVSTSPRRPAIALADVLGLLMRLVDKSLVVVEQEGESRYGLLETVRQYGRDKLVESGDEERVRGRHLDFFLRLAEEAEPELKGPEQVAWLNRLEAEHDNLRAALEWSLKSGRAEGGLRLAGALWWFWFVHGYLSEGREWLEEALSKGGSAPEAVRAKALCGAGALAWIRCDYAAATARLEESAEIFRKIGDKWGITIPLDILGLMAYLQGDYDRAMALGEESLALCKELGDKRGTAHSLRVLGLVTVSRGDYSRAKELCEESLALFLELGDRRGISLPTIILGRVAYYQSDYVRATALYNESLTLLRELGDKWYIAQCLEGLAEVARSQGGAERATRLFGAAEALRQAIGVPLPPSDRAEYDRSLAALRSGLGEEVFAKVWGEGRRMTMEEIVEWAVGSRQ